MMQARTSETYNSLSQEIFTNIQNNNDFQEDDLNSSDGEEYFSSSSELESQDSSLLEEEEEEYNVVLYHLPAKKTDPKEEKLRAEKLQERHNKIQEKKQQIKGQDKLIRFLERSKNDSRVSLKLLSKLSRPKYQVNFCCYIPKRNLLFVALVNSRTVHIYSTMNFNLVAERSARQQLGCMSYSKDLRKIIVGGEQGLLQLWSAKTLEVKADSFLEGNEPIISVEYIPKSHVIVAKSSFHIFIYNTSLGRLRTISLSSYYREWYSDTAEIHGVSKDFLLVGCHYEIWNRLSLINIKSGDSKQLDNIMIPSVSCIQVTEKSPETVFTCLASFESKPLQSYPEGHPFELTQFTIDKKTGELVLSRRTTTPHFFSKLSAIENSKYLLAHKSNSIQGEEMRLLSINKGQVEILYVISRSSITLNRFSTFIMTKEGSSIIEINGKSIISVYGLVISKEKKK